MEFYHLQGTGLSVSKIAYGCMGIGGSRHNPEMSDEVNRSAMASINAALESGINFFDHADIYCRGNSESVFSHIWKEHPSLRSEIILQTKCGICFPGVPEPSFPQRYDFSYEHIVSSAEDSLKRLKTDYIDFFLLHRPDPLAEPEEVAKAFDYLHSCGKVRFFGLSNHNAAQISLLKKYLNQPMVVNQLEFSLLHSDLIDEGVAVNQLKPERAIRGDGTLEYCRENGIMVQAWSPLAKGALGNSAASSADERIRKAAETVGKFAEIKGVSSEAILAAWILRHPANIQPIIGTTNPGRIKACSQAAEIRLSREEWYELYLAGRGEPLP